MLAYPRKLETKLLNELVREANMPGEGGEGGGRGGTIGR